jgi:LmbE family N-acetylglucosaminyl deacetylase
MRFLRSKPLNTFIALLVALFLSSSVAPQLQHAQTTEIGFADRTARAELHQSLLDLTNSFTVLCVAAHPDDEDGSTLTVLRRKYGVHTVSLFSTYGEGGQNAVGPELYEELGVIRARETMAAAEVQGSEPHFLGFRDFGFQNQRRKPFERGEKRKACAEWCLQIRTLRPDVVITNHDTTSGHGHHQATGRLILHAFDARQIQNNFQSS